MSSVGDRARAVGFLRQFSVRLAHRTELFRWGVAVFEPRLPLVWYLNSVWIDAVPENANAAAFVAELDRLQGAAGLVHRQAVVADEAAGERLAPGLRALGWSARRDILMAWRRSPDRPSDISGVREVETALTSSFAKRMAKSSSEAISSQAIRELAAAKALLAEAGVRFFGATSGGELASVCELHSHGATARIVSVETLPEYRNKGLGRAVICRAVAEAHSAGCDLVFLEAEEEDWPKLLYAKLGFAGIGYLHELTCTPSALAGLSEGSGNA